MDSPELYILGSMRVCSMWCVDYHVTGVCNMESDDEYNNLHSITDQETIFLAEDLEFSLIDPLKSNYTIVDVLVNNRSYFIGVLFKVDLFYCAMLSYLTEWDLK